MVNFCWNEYIEPSVHLQNVSFENSLSEDSLNLIDSKSNINNLSFNSKSDALDIDGGVLNISKLYNKIGNDCLDFSNAIINGDDILQQKSWINQLAWEKNQSKYFKS